MVRLHQTPIVYNPHPPDSFTLRTASLTLRTGDKKIEGRPRYSFWPNVQVGDGFRFNVSDSGRKTLCMRVTKVEVFGSFAEMLESCGVPKCLPQFRETNAETIAAGVEIYRAFKSTGGVPFGTLEAEEGVVAVHVKPVR